MIGKIEFKERGATPRGMAKRLKEHKKIAGQEMGEFFHREQVDLRFDPLHARRVGYQPRTRKYQARKRGLYNHNNPLEFSGATRRAVRAQAANIHVRATAKETTIQAKYPAARQLNRTNVKAKKTPIRMAEEFRRISTTEARELARVFDAALDQRLQNDNVEAIQKLA